MVKGYYEEEIESEADSTEVLCDSNVISDTTQILEDFVVVAE